MTLFTPCTDARILACTVNGVTTFFVGSLYDVQPVRLSPTPEHSCMSRSRSPALVPAAETPFRWTAIYPDARAAVVGRQAAPSATKTIPGHQQYCNFKGKRCTISSLLHVRIHYSIRPMQCSRCWNAALTELDLYVLLAYFFKIKT